MSYFTTDEYHPTSTQPGPVTTPMLLRGAGTLYLTTADHQWLHDGTTYDATIHWQDWLSGEAPDSVNLSAGAFGGWMVRDTSAALRYVGGGICADFNGKSTDRDTLVAY